MIIVKYDHFRAYFSFAWIKVRKFSVRLNRRWLIAASGDRVREVHKARGTDKHRISQESGDSPNICKWGDWPKTSEHKRTIIVENKKTSLQGHICPVATVEPLYSSILRVLTSVPAMTPPQMCVELLVAHKLTRMKQRSNPSNTSTGTVSTAATPISTGAISHTTSEERGLLRGAGPSGNL